MRWLEIVGYMLGVVLALQLLDLLELRRLKKQVKVVRIVSSLSPVQIADHLRSDQAQQKIIDAISRREKGESTKQKLERMTAKAFEEYQKVGGMTEQFSNDISPWLYSFNQMCLVLKTLYPADYPMDMRMNDQWFQTVRKHYTDSQWESPL